MHEAPHPLLDQVQSLGTGLLQGPLNTVLYLHQLARLLRLHYRCAQVSIWSLAGHGEAQSATCLARDHDDQAAPPPDNPQPVEGHQAYFDRLRAQGYVASTDTHADPALHGVRERYLRAGAPRALLDAAFTVNGRTFGILCCEELAGPRRWGAEEVMLLRRVASRVALHLKAHEVRAGARLPDEPAPAAG